MKRARSLAVALLTCVGFGAIGVGAANAIPVGSLTVLKPYKPTLRFTARLISPSHAANCTAAAAGALERWVGGRYIIARELPRRNFNVCPDGNRGTTYAPIQGSFSTGTLPKGRYRLCIAASQILTNGQADTDVNCKVVLMP